MNYDGKLVLEDGSEFPGVLFGTRLSCDVGEVVFNTSMVGYQEILTDPSYCDQIICMTYPLIGNYGVSQDFNESHNSACKGMIVRELALEPSHCFNEQSLNDYFKEKNLVCLSEVDTRGLTKKIREHGTLKGKIIGIEESSAKAIEEMTKTHLQEQVSKVSSKDEQFFGEGEKHIVLYDFGTKSNIRRCLTDLCVRVTQVPFDTTYERVKELNPDGVCLSNGPGNPEDLEIVVSEIKKIQDEFPVLGICLGHQILALANGAKTKKMLYGHRGANHPVKDLETGRVFMSSQNHGYVVGEDSLKGTDLIPSFLNVNDGSVEGVKHKSLNVFSVQFHPEYCPGPRDTDFIFKDFLSSLGESHEAV